MKFTRHIYHLQKYDGSFVNVVKEAEHSAQKLLKLVVEEFPSFRDVSTFEGKQGRFNQDCYGNNRHCG